LGAVVEATGNAGDVLVMHPLLIHAVNDARRVTFHVSSDPQMGPRWTAVQHGIRVSFNLAVHWSRLPLKEPDKAPHLEPRSILEHSLITPIAEGIRVAENAERLLTYGEVVELRFVECGMMMGVELDYEGLVFASYGRVPARSAHDLRFHAPGRPKGGAGMAVCYGDELVLKGRGEKGSWHRLGMSHVRDLEPKARALCRSGESTVACVQWGKQTTPRQLFRVEGFCDLRGVPLRAGDRFYLRCIGATREGMAHGGHLQANWQVDWEVRQVGTQALRKEQMHEIEAFKVGPMRSWGLNNHRELNNLN